MHVQGPCGGGSMGSTFKGLNACQCGYWAEMGGRVERLREGSGID